MATSVEVTTQDIEKIVEKLAARSSNGGNKSFKIKSLSDTLGFLGEHLILKIFSDNEEMAELFLKAIPRHIEKRMEYIQETGFFEREIKFYKHFTPALNSLSSRAWSPLCYLAKMDHFLVLENLKDYKTFPSQLQVFDYAHFRVMIETLAIFHASSLIYEAKFGKLTSEKLELLTEVSHPQIMGNLRTVGLENATDVFLDLIKLIPKYASSPRLGEILEKFPSAMRIIFKYVQTSSKLRNVISHGDLWVQNVMFKYDANDNISGCKFIDFQFARYSPPAVDITTVLYASTTREFRELYLDEMLGHYCESIKSELARHDIDQSIVLPREEITESVREYRQGGLVEALLFQHLTLLPSEITSSMMNSSEEYEKFIVQSRREQCIKAFQVDFYCQRITEILCELIDEYILK